MPAGCCTTDMAFGLRVVTRVMARGGLGGSGDRMSCNAHHQRRAVMRRAVIGLVAVGSLVSARRSSGRVGSDQAALMRS